MKKIFKFSIIMAFTPLLAPSCVEILDEGGMQLENDTVTLTLHSDSATKTILSEEKYVFWEDGDQIWVNGTLYPVVIDESNPGTAYVENVALATEYIASTQWGMEELNEELGSDDLVVRIPTSQLYREGSFGAIANAAAAYSKTTDLHFYNMSSVIKLGVKGDNISLQSVSVSGNNGEAMSGFYRVNESYWENLHTVEEIVPYNDYNVYPGANLFFENPVQLSDEAQYFYIVVPPHTYQNGITVTLSDTEGRICVQSTSKSFTAKRAEIFTMADFTFSESESLEVGEVTADIKSVSYKVTGQANSGIRTLLFYKSAWDYLAENSFKDNLEDLPAAILNTAGTTVQIDANGNYETVINSAWNFDAKEISIIADTDYKLLVSYADGINSLGEIIVKDVRTLPAEGTAPVVELSVGEVNWNTVALHIGASEDVTDFIYYHYRKTDYDAHVAEGKTDREILLDYGWNLNGLVDQAKNGGFNENMQRDAESEFVILIMAVNATGMEDIKKVIYATEEYTVTNAEWEVVSTSAALTGGLIYLWGTNDDISGLTVEKIVDSDYFRIVDLPKALNNYFSGSQYELEVSETAHYFYIDARDNDNIILPHGENPLNLISEWNGVKTMYFCSYKQFIEGENDYKYGSYEPGADFIYLGHICPVAYYYYNPSDITLNFKTK